MKIKGYLDRCQALLEEKKDLIHSINKLRGDNVYHRPSVILDERPTIKLLQRQLDLVITELESVLNIEVMEV